MPEHLAVPAYRQRSSFPVLVTGHALYDVSAEALCEDFHKPS
jgi:hypothetical protein